MKRVKKNAPAANGRTTANDSQSSNTQPSESQGGKHKWRDHYAVHPAAEFFHGFSTTEQLDELRDDIDKAKVIYDRIHTATVFGKTFVIDGVSRLDQAEKTGREIIDEKGNWIGMLKDNVAHHPGKTDEQVWGIVISLNHKRRHYTTGQLSAMADTLATARRGKPKSANLQNNQPSDQAAEMQNSRPVTIEQAAKTVGVSPRSVHQFRNVKKEAPDKAAAISKGKKTIHRAVSEIEAEKPKRKLKKVRVSFEDAVWKRYTLWINGKGMFNLLKEWQRTNRDAEQIIRNTLCEQK